MAHGAFHDCIIIYHYIVHRVSHHYSIIPHSYVLIISCYNTGMSLFFISTPWCRSATTSP